METIFDTIYKLLKWISNLTGFTYREINIITYFMIIPSLFFYLMSKIYRNKYIILIFLGLITIITLFIPDFESFSDKLFDISVRFLLWFKHIGLNYVEASVVICVILPILILILLFYLKKRKNKNYEKRTHHKR